MKTIATKRRLPGFAWLCTLLMVLTAVPAYAGTKHYYYTDAQGTVLAKADAQANIVASYDYAPYGTQVLGAPPSGPSGYTGHVNDAESGLVYMQARYYDPVVGRFLSVDPVGVNPDNAGSLNRYAYVNNNPSRYTDPSGKTCVKADGDSSYDCKVDENPEKFSEKEIGTMNAAYTSSVNGLLANSKKTVPITVDGKTIFANAGDVAKELIGATVVARVGDGGARASTLGGGLTPAFKRNGHAVTTIYRNALEKDRSGARFEVFTDLSRTFVHEGIHMLNSDSNMMPLYKSNPRSFNVNHRDAYNEASFQLYPPDQFDIW